MPVPSRIRSEATRLARLCLGVLALALLVALPSAASAGTIVADTGFRPDPNGFSFSNYGDEEGYADLDAAEMQRMFGPAVCLAGKGGSCVLTPTANLWMEAQNEGMAGGHCFGFATLAELVYDGRLPQFGYAALSAFAPSAESPFQLGIGSVRLQRSIARAWAYQSLAAVTDRAVAGTPTEVLDFLRAALRRSGEEGWTMTIFQRGFKGGHAITPYAVEDMGDGVFEVHVYDNNWPDDDSRRLTIDTNHDTWSYYAAINPGIPAAEYEGDAKTKTLGLMPTRPGLGTQPCPFCVGRQGSGSDYNEIRLDGGADRHAHLLIVDGEGRQTGFLGNRLVNRIPGAEVLPRTSGPRPTATGGAQFVDSPEPVYKLPRNVRFKVRVNGKRLKVADRETLTLVGPSYDATVENLVMAPGQVADVRLSPRGNALTYRSSRRTQTPTVSFGAESEQAAYRVSVSALGAPPRSSMTFVKRPKYQLMWIGDSTAATRHYRLSIDRLTVKGDSTFARTFTIAGDQQGFLYYGPLAEPDGVAKVVIYSPDKERLRALPVRAVGAS
jgi:hypothetical protein